jgi:predicted nucleotidyltransferase
MALATIDEKLIRYVTDTIVEHFHPRRIILFGSHARGDPHPDSDLDLLIEMETDLPFYERIIEVDSVFGLRGWPMDILVYTPVEMKAERSKVFSIAKIADREGKVLYDAG